MNTTGKGGEWVEVYPGKEALVRFDPSRTFTCVDQCTWCCHHGVLLYDPDVFSLAEYAQLHGVTTTVKGEQFIETEEKQREAHVDAQGNACHFLDDEGKCSLHATHEWKPTRCSVFPLEIEVLDGSIMVDIREDAEEHCEGLDVDSRRLIDHLDAFLPPVLWDLPNPETSVEL